MDLTQNHIFSSKEAIELTLSSLGLNRDGLSTYKEYKYEDGGHIRLRISNHGLFLQNWHDHNKEERMKGADVPKLDIGFNLAITFAPNEEECKEMHAHFPMKIKNVTMAKTEHGNNVKPQFTVRHICYFTWRLTQDDIDAIIANIVSCVKNEKQYIETIKDTSKVKEWLDTSNMPPRNILPTAKQQNVQESLKDKEHMRKNVKIIKLTEQDVNRIIKASVCNALRESNESELNRDLESAISKGNFDVEVNESYEMLVTIYGDYANYYIDATVDVNGSEDSYDWSIVNVEHVSIMGEDDDEEYPMNYVPNETVLSQISSSQKAEDAVYDAYQKISEWNGWKEFEYDK